MDSRRYQYIIMGSGMVSLTKVAKNALSRYIFLSVI